MSSPYSTRGDRVPITGLSPTRDESYVSWFLDRWGSDPDRDYITFAAAVDAFVCVSEYAQTQEEADAESDRVAALMVAAWDRRHS